MVTYLKYQKDGLWVNPDTFLLFVWGLFICYLGWFGVSFALYVLDSGLSRHYGMSYFSKQNQEGCWCRLESTE